MMEWKHIKEELKKQLLSDIQTKMESVVHSIDGARESRDSEEKSSAGDKYETGRAMSQMELEKFQVQLSKFQKAHKEISDITIEKPHSNVQFGSVVLTDKINFFIAGAQGKLKVDGKEYIVISLASPVGQVIRGREKGEYISVNGRNFEILALY